MTRFLTVVCVALSLCASVVEAAPIVRVQVRHLGHFDIQLHNNTPLHRDNFVQYVNDGFYTDNVFHRSDHRPGNYVLQTASYKISESDRFLIDPVVGSYPSVENEAHLGDLNEAMTIGAARTSDPDSATAGWYINMAHNTGYDHGNGNPGYTVFGHIISGQDVVLAMYNVNVWNAGDMFPMLPLLDSFDNTGPLQKTDFVVIESATVIVTPEPASVAVLGIGLMGLLRRRAQRG